MRPELAAHGASLTADPAGAARVPEQLQRWLDDPALNVVRDPQALALVTDEERLRWIGLWADVRDLMAREPQK